MTEVSEAVGPRRPLWRLSAVRGVEAQPAHVAARSETRAARPSPGLSAGLSGAALLLLAAVLGLTLSGHQDAATFLLLGYLVLGVGALAVQLAVRRFGQPEVAAIALGLAWPLVGLVLVEGPLWWLGRPLFWTVIGLSALGHARRLWTVRHESAGQLGSGGWAARRFAGRHRLIVALSLGGTVTALITAVVRRGTPVRVGGLPTTLGPSWLVGVAAVFAALLITSARARTAIALPAVLLVFVLAASPAIGYPLPRFTWTQKHIGVVQLFLHSGRVLDASDIYQAWPGFFSGIAWLAQGLGAVDVQTLAAWWPVLVDLGSLVLTRRLAANLGATAGLSWLGAVLAVLANTVQQDYFSPQSLAFLWSLVLLCIATRPAGPDGAGGLLVGDAVLFAAGAVILVTSHQLTPFVLTLFLGLLALFRLSRWRWALPFVVLVPTVFWWWRNWGVVGQYYSFDEFGQILGNFRRPSGGADLHYDLPQQLSTAGLAIAPILVGLLGCLAWLLWRDWLAAALVLCGLCPAGIFVAVEYGNEGILRATLFAAAWWAVLASRWFGPSHGTQRWLRLPPSTLPRASLAALPLVFVAYLSATTGYDYVNVVRPSDLAAERTFERQAPAGSTLIEISYDAYQPIRTTYRYPELRFGNYGVITGATAAQSATATATGITEQAARTARQTGKPVYVLGMVQGEAVGQANGLWTPVDYRRTVARLSTAPDWVVVERVGGSTLLRYQP